MTECKIECLEDWLQKVESEHLDARTSAADRYVGVALDELRAVVNKGVTFQKDLEYVRAMRPPLYRVGDQVRDTFRNKDFIVRSVSLERTVTSDHHVLPESGAVYEWYYGQGFYFIPESDLESIV